MTFWLQALAIYAAVTFGIVWAAMKLAKPGYETDKGFKYGRPDDDCSDYSGEV